MCMYIIGCIDVSILCCVINALLYSHKKFLEKGFYLTHLKTTWESARLKSVYNQQDEKNIFLANIT